MGLIADWRAGRERRRLADAYLKRVLTTPETADIEWLAPLVGGRDRAQQELLFAQRAVALIVAERDALDDRTASDVAHALADVLDRESRQSADAGRVWSARWLAYTAALSMRGHIDPPATRLARVLFEGSGLSDPPADALSRVAQVIQGTRTKANESLRAVFGVASLPEDVRPSALRP
jgi:hypothetical protein